MRRIDKLADEKTSTVDDSEQFYDERLIAYTRDEWPSRIDRAALDVLMLEVAIGSEETSNDIGGTIGKLNFGDATGKYYAKGLTELADDQSDLPGLVKQYKRENGADSVGDLAFRLNELRYELEKHLDSESEIRNLNRAVEALIDKLATTSMSENVTRQALRDPESITDAMMQLFSDPAIAEYADVLTETMDVVAQNESFLERLDAPHMTTPLWEHQRDALGEWVNHGCKGYVDMATATGKTVLGLAAVALLYGELHPDDTAQIFTSATAETAQQSLIDELSVDSDDEHARVLVVAGQELILEQWQSEFDEHLNIPRERTQTKGRTMKFTWGSIEFRTAPDLLQMDTLGGYDLVVLDEAHQYSHGGRSGGWQPVLEELAQKSDAILAMSGSIDTSWQGDSAVKRVLEEHLHECKRFSVDEARDAGVVADFEWDVYYAHAADSASQDGVIESTTSIRKVYDPEQHKIRVDKLDGDVPSNTPSGFETLTDLRSFSQSKEGADARDASDAFDRLATDAFTRRPKRWQLHPPIQTLVELIGRHAPEQQCVVLVQSYEQADQIGDVLEDRYGEDLVLVPESGASEQFAEITSFKQKDRGIIVGPANVLGTGVDLPNAEVAINLSKGGVNASLIQRIGRVLRNPHGTKEAMFYQVVTFPSDRRGLLPGEDGRRLLRRASEFRALGARLRQLPGYDVADDPTSETLAVLEQHGVGGVLRDNRSIDEIVEDEVAQAFLRELCDLISTSEDENAERPVLRTFNGHVLDRQARPVAEAVKQHPRTAESNLEQNGTSTGSKSESTSQSSGSAETSEPSMNTHAIEIEISPALNYLVEQELETESYASIDEFTDEVVGKYVSSELDGSASVVASNDDFDVTLPSDIERVIEEKYIGNGADSVPQFIEEAVYAYLDLDTEPKTVAVTLGSGLYQVSSTVAETSEGHETVDEIVTEAIRSEFVR
ncbi:DEAD/DEAH box helicase [Natronorubrum tibetense]|uniref:Type III restriction protein res subunit n=1 Tax=Natronorubrum tibetense GA33 TaxID=1114856 RepID=L9VUA1_9EURY|nr:helicase-related protein [Natronorubrum tibetense]ELY39853.1 type III restriction protein res subunit [Natronorubrum tibetense GA33]